MGRRFGLHSRVLIIVAARARTHRDAGMVHRPRRKRDSAAMAGIARENRSRNMDRGFGLDSRVLIIVATRARARRYPGVLHRPCRKGGGAGMASLAGRSCGS